MPASADMCAAQPRGEQATEVVVTHPWVGVNRVAGSLAEAVTDDEVRGLVFVGFLALAYGVRESAAPAERDGHQRDEVRPIHERRNAP